MTQPAPRTSRILLRDRNLHILFGVTLMVVLGVTSVTPAFPAMIEALGLTPESIGLVVTAFTLPGVFLTPVMGVLADRYGRKPVLVPSLFLFGLAGFACGFCRDFELLLAFRFLQGVGAAAMSALNLSIISDLFADQERTAALGLNASVLSFGVSLYPVLGGGLASAHWSYPFFLPIMAIPLGLVVIFSLRCPEPASRQSLRDYLKSMAAGVAGPRALALFAATLATFVILYGPFLTYMPVRLGKDFGASPAKIGLMMSLAALATGLVASQLGRLARRAPVQWLLKAAFLFYAAACALMAVVDSFWLFALPVALFGFGQGLNLPCIQSLLAQLAPPGRRAGFLALNATLLRVGQTLGPLLMAWVYGFGAMPGVFYAGSVIALAMFVGLWRFRG